MTQTLGNDLADGKNKGRSLVLVSGYYGFDNLGDEAILETLVDELRKLVPPDQIVVLSNNPEKTQALYGVQSINRWKLAHLAKLLPRTKLFLSGGGGLFQDTVSIRSPIFYGSQIILAKLMGAKSMIFAQGIGPLNSTIGKAITKRAYSACDEVTVRDAVSFKQLEAWHVKGTLTADPVWTLAPKSLPAEMVEWQEKPRQTLRIGLSLRTSPNFSLATVEHFAQALAQSLPSDALVVPLPLQPAHDQAILAKFTQYWQSMGRLSEAVDVGFLEKPSQWMAFLKGFDLVVAMRLHCAILALKSGVPTIAIAYDPKVAHLAAEFELPTLNLTNDGCHPESAEQWVSTLRAGVENRQVLAKRIAAKVESARNKACQNFTAIARILGMQSDRD